jgi:acetylornithine deacetylase
MTLQEVTELLSALVSIDSVNPDLIPGAVGEGAVARFAAGWLAERGLEVTLQETGAPGRPNVIAVARGSGGGRALLLNAHLDTVGVAGMEAPFSAQVEAGRLYGRGAQDTKGSAAAFMLAAAAAAGRRLRGDVIFTGVVDEEYASRGTEAVLREHRAGAALVGEPTDLQLAVAHKGFVWLEVETYGVAAHGSRPADGVDAIFQMGKVLAGAGALAESLLRGPIHPLLGSGSLHCGLIEGGQEVSSYPAHCRLDLERRTLPGETAAGALAEIQGVLDSLTFDLPFRGSVHTRLARGPLSLRPDEPIVRILEAVAPAILSRPLITGGVSFWTDAALLAAAGIPAAVIGPTGAGLHSVVEWVDLESVQQLAMLALAAAEAYCGL